MYGV
jgi:hypothetical protein